MNRGKVIEVMKDQENCHDIDVLQFAHTKYKLSTSVQKLHWIYLKNLVASSSLSPRVAKFIKARPMDREAKTRIMSKSMFFILYAFLIQNLSLMLTRLSIPEP